MRLPEPAMAKRSSGCVFNFTICLLRSSSSMFTAFQISVSNASEIANTVSCPEKRLPNPLST